MRQLRSRDAAFLYIGDPHLTGTIVSCWVLAASDGGPATIRADEVVNRMNVAAASADIFAGVLVRLPFDIDLPYWRIADGFDAADHIEFHHGVEDWPAARTVLSDIAARPLDRHKPLWRMHVLVDVADLPGRTGLSTVVAMMFHHAAFDGVTFAQLTNTYLDDNPIPWPYDASGTAIGPDTASRTRLTIRAVVRTPVIWGQFAGELFSANVARVRERTPSVAAPPPNPGPPTPFGGRVRGDRVTDYAVLSLSQVKAIKNRVPGATVNDVMLSVIGGALVTHLTSRGHRPGRSLQALVPLSTRSIDDSAAANQVVPMIVDMHTTESSVDARLAAIATTSASAKKAASESALARGTGVIHRVPALLLRVLGAITRILGRVTAPSTQWPDTVVANVYSPHSIDSMFGMNVVSGFGIQPLETPTLAHGIYSRDDDLLVSVTTDSAVLADPTTYLAAVRESFAEHVRVLLAPEHR